MLDDILPEAMQISGTSIFQHARAPSHPSHMVQSWVREHSIQPLEWPGSSPDLNPIENLWKVLKRKVAARRPGNQIQLESAIREIWENEIDAEICVRLIESMPSRIMATIRQKGWPTKY